MDTNGNKERKRIPYSKAPLSYDKQIELLKNRGLLISDEKKALFLLEHLSYYRLSGYWYPLLEDKELHTFNANSTFEQAFEYYCFDKELRKLIFSEIEKIEVAIRAKMIFNLSMLRDKDWQNDVNMFKSIEKFQSLTLIMQTEFDRSSEDFVKKFKLKYIDHPPSWIQLETTSFGTLSKLYSNLKPFYQRNIANHFKLNETVFHSWLHTLVFIRNICAHHGRLWNRNLSINPSILKNSKLQWIENINVKTSKLYYSLSIIRFLLLTVNPNSSFPLKVRQLFAQYNSINPSQLGFPSDWQSIEFWKLDYKSSL